MKCCSRLNFDVKQSANLLTGMKLNPHMLRAYWFHVIPQRFQFSCRRWASKRSKAVNNNTWIVNENDLRKYSPAYKLEGEHELYMVQQQHERSKVRFQKLPLHENVQQGLYKNFPEIRYCTPVQMRIIRAFLMNRFSFMVRGWNGSGKSFSGLLAALSMYHEFMDKFSSVTNHGCQVLIVVPNKNLAQQYQARVEKLVSGEPLQEPLQKVSQVLEVSLFRIEEVKRNLPFILIADYRDLERLKKLNHPILGQILTNLKTIVFDESDLYIPTEGRQRRLSAPEPRTSSTSLSSFIHLCREHSMSSKTNNDLSEKERQTKMKNGTWLPSLIFISATNSWPCADYVGSKVTNQLGVIGINRKFQPYWNLNCSSKIQHFLIEATRDQRSDSLRMEDVKYEYAREPNLHFSIGDAPLFYENVEMSADMFVNLIRKTLLELYKDHRVKLAPKKNILIIIPKEFDVSWFCEKYQRIGTSLLRSFECYPLKGEGIPESHEQKQIAYVANASEIRGVYLPEVSHVFHLWSTLSAASYLHIAGRTGYLHKNGMVFNFLLPEFLRSQDFESLNCSRSALLVLQRIGVRPHRFFEEK
ncbi:RNA helicase [Schizosaccharomyces cryophilus OY26]|uniref:ATP-dependent RNA helicase n=1 Tax=Schizosaccharomyces cryophilus (strain OY26 / ATCC MYA-4695 / CBS 11777 / NBRC 106824 / NRRL Y48691) TaxID=653667 RepID=S9XJ87_SCHCR|nr:RNA helicase [Schizosaccharomyces cryophilus OY26]EPY53691.1 RNA helicase [Schizosaccharomyces cryophilus OY26]